MACKDRRAASLIRELREERGLSPEALSAEIFKTSGLYVSGRTIRRIEDIGAVPSVRVKFVIASFFDRSPASIWTGGRARERAAA